MTNKELKRKIYAKIDELPTIPIVVTRVLALTEDEKATVNDLTNVIEADPALTAKILKVANSAYYGFPQTIATLDRAVALLGQNMVKSLALSIGVIQNLPVKDTPQFTRRGLWLHSLAVATVIKELSRRTGKGRKEDYLFVVGLLHDIGKIALLNFFFAQYQQVLEQSATLAGEMLCEIERRTIGLDHGLVGAMLLDRWKFPPAVVRTIKAHHFEAKPEDADHRDVALLETADHLCLEFENQPEMESNTPEMRAGILEAAGLSGPEDMASLREFLVEQRENIEHFYSAVN